MAETGTGTATVAAPKARVSKAKAAARATTRARNFQRAAILLKQASEPTRLQILISLAEGEKHVGALCEELHQSQPACSHHLALLRHGSLISPRRQGKNNFYALTDAGRELARVVGEMIG